MAAITEKQEEFIETLSRKAGFASPQAACAAAGIPSRNWRYDLSRTDASDLIEQLKNGLEREPEPEPEPVPVTMPEGGPTAELWSAMMGRNLRPATAPKGEGYQGEEVEPICLRQGAPAIEVGVRGSTTRHIRAANRTGWSE